MLNLGSAKIVYVTHSTMAHRLLQAYPITVIFWLGRLKMLLLAGHIKMGIMLNVGLVGIHMVFQ